MMRRLFLLLALAGTPVRAEVAVIQGQVLIQGQVIAAQDESATPAKKAEDAAAVADAGPSLLRWNNGETLRGEVLEASATALTWKSPLFDEPLVLNWHVLRRIDQVPGGKAIEPFKSVQRFQALLRDGSHVIGNLSSIDEGSVTVESTRHGTVVLKRSEVLSLRRLRGEKLVYAGPTGDAGWEPRSDLPKTTQPRPNAGNTIEPASLTVGPGGALTLPFWNRAAVTKVELPDIVDIQFRVRSSNRPDFRLTFEGEPKQPMHIETWDNELVLATEEQFQSIRKIGDAEREIALRFCWDRITGQCFVFGPDGKLLQQWEYKDDITKPRGTIVLLNKGRDLSLELLRVRQWDGNPTPKELTAEPRVELSDGGAVNGIVRTCSADAVVLSAKGDKAEQTVPLASVDSIVFSQDQPKVAEAESKLTFGDGTLLFGKIESIKEGQAALRTSFADNPITSRFEGFRQLVLRVPAPKDAPPEPPLSQLDKLTFQQTVLHGKLASEGGDRPKWLPVGGTKPSAPAPSAASEISRALPADGKISNELALFYTTAGDVLPGKLRSLSKTEIEFESSYIEATKLPADQLDAIQFGAAAREDIVGFDAPGWRLVKGDPKLIERTHDSLKLEPGAVFAHPSAMQSSEIRFSIISDQFSTLRMRLFCAGTEPAQATNLMILRYSDRVTCGIEGSDGQFASQTQVQVPAGPTAVRLLIQERQLELYLNGDLAQKFPINPSKRAGSGLLLEAASMWGNSVRPISITGFTAPATPGGTWMPDVNLEAKSQALTVPRFRKDDPPRQALVAANGDVLRGEIEAITATHLGFRSGLESLRVPLARVKAAVWLKKPEGEAVAAQPENPARKVLEKRIERRIRYSSASLSVLTSVLDREAGGLKFQLPKESDERRFGMQFGDQTVGEALDQICSLFDIAYRIDDKGVIVLEPRTRVPKGFVQKVYWLKPGVFPATPSAQEILTQKGVSFPTGAAAVWQSKTQQLIVTNTAANQGKVTQLLASDFGGSFGSPTHWLLLTNGARLSLAVDKFEKTAITGHHPVFGKCTVPVSEIYVIRTTPPQPTPVMRTFQDWRLVYAPEPVIPEAGGASSALVGTEAKAFKLPMLTGGDFELGKEKGKVIVLDFWATWCGPCVKSLPELIETVSHFSPDKVHLVGVNQSEAVDEVKRFVETRDWRFTVVMDAGATVAQQYGVEGIPHTVIVGPDGKIAWVRSGYLPGGEKEIADTIQKLLEPAATPEAPAAAASPAAPGAPAAL